MQDAVDLILGTEDAITWFQMSLRAIVVFLFALLLVRLGDKRAFGKNTSFDIVLGVILGSVLSRAVTGNSPLLPTLAAAITLVLLHLGLTRIAFRSRRLGKAIKGIETRLVADGEYLRDAMRKTGMTERDIHEGLRRHGHEQLGEVGAVYLERSGEVSVVPRQRH